MASNTVVLAYNVLPITHIVYFKVACVRFSGVDVNMSLSFNSFSGTSACATGVDINSCCHNLSYIILAEINISYHSDG